MRSSAKYDCKVRFGGCHSLHACTGDANDMLVLFESSLVAAGIFVSSAAGADRKTFLMEI